MIKHRVLSPDRFVDKFQGNEHLLQAFVKLWGHGLSVKAATLDVPGFKRLIDEGNGDRKDEFLEELHRVYDLCTDRGQEDLCAACRDSNYEPDPDGTLPVELLSLKVRTENEDAFNLAYDRAWFVAGCPKAQTPVLGSFESWCTVAGGILAFAGVPDFLGNLDDLYRQADPTLQQWEAFITLLYEKTSSHGFTVAEVGEMLRRDTELLGAVPEELGDIEKRDSFPRKLGRAFLRRQNRRHGPDELFLVRGEEVRGAARWIIKKGKT